MSIVLLVYLASIVENIQDCGVMMMSGIPVVFFSYMFLLSCENIGKSNPTKMKYVKTMVSLFIFGVILSVFTPKEKTIYLMVGASIAQDIASNPKTIEMFDKVYKIVDKKLEEQLTGEIDKVKEATK